MTEPDATQQTNAVAAPAYDVAPVEPKPDAVPPGYKRTEVGVIPEDWEIAPIRNLGTVVTGGTPPTSDASNYGDYLPFATPADISEAKYIWNTLRSLSYKGAAISRSLPNNSILFVSIGSTIGKCGITPVVMTSNQQINSVIPHHRYQTDYLYYAISLASDHIRDSAAIQAVPIVNKSQFSATLLPIPGVDEQLAIATALSDADALIAALDRLIAKKRAIKQGAMQQLLTGRTRLPGFTGPWHTRRLGEHLKILKNGTNSRAELIHEGEVKYLHYGDIHGIAEPLLDVQKKRMPYLPDEKASRLDRLHTGDLVFADASEDIDGVGKSVEVSNTENDAAVSGLHTIAVRFDKEVLADGFKAYLQYIPAFSRHLRRHAAGTKVYATNRSYIESAEVLLPCVEEQTAIATALSDMDAEIEALERRRAKARAIKQGMMQQLLTGRVRLVAPEGAA